MSSSNSSLNTLYLSLATRHRDSEESKKILGTIEKLESREYSRGREEGGGEGFHEENGEGNEEKRKNLILTLKALFQELFSIHSLDLSDKRMGKNEKEKKLQGVFIPIGARGKDLNETVIAMTVIEVLRKEKEEEEEDEDPTFAIHKTLDSISINDLILTGILTLKELADRHNKRSIDDFMDVKVKIERKDEEEEEDMEIEPNVDCFEGWGGEEDDEEEEDDDNDFNGGTGDQHQDNDTSFDDFGNMDEDQDDELYDPDHDPDYKLPTKRQGPGRPKKMKKEKRKMKQEIQDEEEEEEEEEDDLNDNTGNSGTLEGVEDWDPIYKNEFYKCEICYKEFARRVNFRRHMKIRHGIKNPKMIAIPHNADVEDIKGEFGNESYGCISCDKVFSSDGALRRHTLLVHEKTNSYKCTKCPHQLFVFYEDYVKHNELAHGIKRSEMENDFSISKKCNFCKKVMAPGVSLELHLEQFHGEEIKNGDNMNDKMLCPMCGVISENQEDLKNHVLSSHPKEEYENYTDVLEMLKPEGSKCNVCFAEFASDEALMTHFKNHDPSEIFRCTRCNKVYGSAAALEHHIDSTHIMTKRSHSTTSHTIKEKEVCHLCGGHFNNVQAHIESVHEEKLRVHKYKCGICAQTFIQSKVLSQHYKLKHPGQARFPCDRCDYATDVKAVLTKHLKASHGVKTEPKYTCGICHKKFWASHHMRDHYNLEHPGQKRFPCLLCDFAEDIRMLLYRHMRAVHNISC